MFVDLATFGAFVVFTILAFFVLEFLIGGRRVATSAGDLSVYVPLGDIKKAGPLKRALAHTVPQSANEVENIRKDLIRAGYYGSSALEDYLATRNVFIWLVLILFTALAVIEPPGATMAMVLLITGLVLAALIYSLPRLALSRQAKARVGRIERGLPDALDILQMCLTGGLPLREGLQHVAGEIRHTYPDIAVEFEIVRRQADAGTMGNALRNFAERVDAPDVKALAAMVTHNERIGTEVATAVAEFADRMRLSYRQRAEERASKAGVLLLFPIILCLVPPLLIAIAGPPILRLRNFLIEANQPGGVLDFSQANELLQSRPQIPQQQAQQQQQPRRPPTVRQ